MLQPKKDNFRLNQADQSSLEKEMITYAEEGASDDDLIEFKNTFVAEKKKDTAQYKPTSTPQKLVSGTPTGSSVGVNPAFKSSIPSPIPDFNSMESVKKPIEKLKNPPVKEETSFFDYLKENLDTGLATVSKSIYDAPGLVYDAAASITNPIIKGLTGYDGEGASSDKLANDLGFKNIPSDILKEKIKVSNEKINAYSVKNGGDALQSVQDGNYVNAAKLVAGTTMQSLPIMVAAMASGGQTSALTAIGLSTASTKNAQLKEENPEIGLGTRVLNATNAGIIEAVTGHLFTGASGAVMKKILANKGVEAGSKIIGKSFRATIEKSIEKNPLVGAVGEVIEESAVEFGNQVNDMSSGIRTEFDFHAIKNAGLSATGMGGLQTLGVYGAKGYVKAKSYAKLKSTNKEVFKLRNEIDGGNLSPENKAILSLRADRLEAENKKLLGTEIEKVKALPTEQKAELNALNNEFEDLKTKFDDIDDADDIPANLKPAMKEEIRLQASKNQKRKTEILSQNDGLEVNDDFSKFEGVEPDFDLENGKISSLPLKEQDRLNKLAVEKITGGDKTIEYTKEQVSETANEIYKNEQTPPTPEAQPQAEVPQQAEAEKVVTPPVEDVVATSVENIQNNGLKISGVTSIEFEDNNETILYGTKNNRTRISIKGMSKEQIKEEYDFDKQVFDKNKNRDFKAEEIEIKKSIGLTDNEKISALKELKSSKRYNDILENITLPFYETKLNEKLQEGDITPNASIRPTASNVGESGITKQESPIQESVSSSVDGGEVKGDAEVTIGKNNHKFYTGRKTKIEDFSKTKGEFIFFSKDKKVSEHYGGDNITEANVDTSGFLDLSTQEKKTAFVKENFTDEDIHKLYPDIKRNAFGRQTNIKGFEEIEKEIIQGYRTSLENNRFSGDGEVQNAILRKIKAKGHTGVVLEDSFFGKKDMSYVVFDKSVINSGKAEVTGKKIEPHKEVNTDVETVKKELNLNEVDNLLYDELKDTPADKVFDKIDKIKDDKLGEIETIEKKMDDVDLKMEDNGEAIDKIDEDETLSATKKKKAIAVLEKEFKDLQKQRENLESEKEGVEKLITDIDDTLFHPTEDYNADKVSELINKVNTRLETRKSIKEGTNLFPEDANIPEFVAVKKELIKLTDEKTIADFNSRTAEQIKESEPIIADIKSKAKNAERISKEELEKGIADAEKLLENKKTDGVSMGKSRPVTDLDIAKSNLKFALIARDEAIEYLNTTGKNPFADKVTYNKAKLADAKRRIKSLNAEIDKLTNVKEVVSESPKVLYQYKGVDVVKEEDLTTKSGVKYKKITFVDGKNTTLTESAFNSFKKEQIELDSEGVNEGVKPNNEGVKKPPTTKERIAERIKLSDAKIDADSDVVKAKIKAFMDMFPSADINPDDYHTNGFSSDAIIDMVAKAAKAIAKGGIVTSEHIKEAIKAYNTHFDDEIDPKLVEERINSKKEAEKETTSNSDMEDFRDSWNLEPSSDEINQYDSGRTIAREHGETRNNQDYEVQKDYARVQIGIRAIEHAKRLFGAEYVEKTLSFIEQANLSPEKKAVAYVLLENEMDARAKEFPNNVGVQKLQDLVRAKSQEFLANSARAMGAGRFRVERFRELAKNGFSEDEFTNSILTTKQIKDKAKIQKLIQVSPDDINNESEYQESDEDFVIEEPTVKRNKEAVKKDISNVLAQMRKDLLKVAKGNVAMSSIPYAAQLQAVAPHIIKLSKLLAELGGMTTRQIVNEVYNDIKEVFPGINKSDVSDILKEHSIKKAKPKTEVQKKQDSIKEIVKKALIEKGFSREITVTKNERDASGKLIKDADGRNVKTKEKRTVLDWKKLAGEAGTIANIRKNVEESLKGSKYSKDEISEMQKALEKEYVRLTTDVIEKGLNELQNRNAERKPVNTKSAAKKLAELFNYGLFEKNKDSYEKIINSVLGFNGLDQNAFNEMKEIARGYAVLMDSGLSDTEIKSAVNSLSRRQSRLVATLAFSQADWKFKLAVALSEITNLSTRFKLVNLGNLAENVSSGMMARAANNMMDAIANGITGKKTSNKAIREQSKITARAKLRGITLETAESYGDTSSLLLNHSAVEDYFNNATTNKAYHALISTYMAKPVLEGADSYNKILITEAKMVRATIKVLEAKGMSNSDALDYVANAITGESMKEALVKAKALIEKVNDDVGRKMLNDSESSIKSLASDIVKESLVSRGQLSETDLKAIYTAAYKSAGKDIGHVSNNWVTDQISAKGAQVEKQVADAIKEKKWGVASGAVVNQIIWKNFISTFVGGGTNWFVKGLQKSANPLSLISLRDDMMKLKMAGKLDVTTDEGIKNMEESLYRGMNLRSTSATMLMGAIITASIIGGMSASGADDEIAKWLKENQWAKKFFDKMVPDAVVLMLAIKDKDFGRYIAKMVNVKADFFDDQKNTYKILEKYAKGYTEDDAVKISEASGDLGAMLGKRFELPGPLRAAKDMKQIYKGVVKGEYDKTNYYTSGFMNGFFQGGIIDMWGLRKDPDFIENDPQQTFLKDQEKKRLLYKLPENEKVKIRVDRKLTRVESDVKTLQNLQTAQQKGLPYFISMDAALTKQQVKDMDLSGTDESVARIKQIVSEVKAQYGIEDEE